MLIFWCGLSAVILFWWGGIIWWWRKIKNYFLNHNNVDFLLSSSSHLIQKKKRWEGVIMEEGQRDDTNGCLLIKINWKKSGKVVIGIFDSHYIDILLYVICARWGFLSFLQQQQLKAHFIPLLMTKFCYHVHAPKGERAKF